MKTLPMTSGFSFHRFLQVTRRTLQIKRRTYTLGYSGTFIGLYALWLLAMLFGVGPAEAETSAMILGIGILIYHVAGLVLTATTFSELQSPDSASQLLTLPATTSEKLFSSWFISFILYTLTTLVVLAALLLLMFITSGLFFGESFKFAFGITALEPISNILTYMLYNSIFLLGAVFFRGNNFLKTAFSILLFFLLIGIQSIIFINLVSPDSIQTFSRFPFGLQGELGRLLLQLIYTLPLTALFLVFSFFRLKNRQVV
ncbi:MAG TPA: hypothetical protein VJ915_05325 [Balneolaceae bacterium]|nr:hypothetical protein [Balneolaceae bacterium]